VGKNQAILDAKPTTRIRHRLAAARVRGHNLAKVSIGGRTQRWALSILPARKMRFRSIPAWICRASNQKKNPKRKLSTSWAVSVVRQVEQAAAYGKEVKTMNIPNHLCSHS
jgi:hypothetical protein